MPPCLHTSGCNPDEPCSVPYKGSDSNHGPPGGGRGGGASISKGMSYQGPKRNIQAQGGAAPIFLIAFCARHTALHPMATSHKATGSQQNSHDTGGPALLISCALQPRERRRNSWPTHGRIFPTPGWMPPTPTPQEAAGQNMLVFKGGPF